MKRASIPLLSCFWLFACATTPTTHIAEFGLSIEQVSQEIDKNIDAFGELAMQEQADSLAYLTMDQSSGGRCSFSAEDVLANPGVYDLEVCRVPLLLKDLDYIVNPVSPQTRKQLSLVKANKQLAAYAIALTQLANVASKVEIQQSSIALTGSLGSMYDAYLDLRYAKQADAETTIADKQQQFAEQQALLTTVIAGFASALTEEQRRKALKQVINQGEAVLQELIPAMVKEVESAKLQQTMATLQNSVLTDDLIQYNLDAMKAPMSHEQAAASIRQFHQRSLEIQSAALRDQQTVKALQQIAKSHSAIAEEVNKDRFTSKEISATVSALNKEYKAFRSFKSLLESCEGELEKGEDGFLHCKS